MEEFFTLREVADYLKLSTQTVRRMVNDGRLAAYKIGRSNFRISKEAVTTILCKTIQPSSDLNILETREETHD